MRCGIAGLERKPAVKGAKHLKQDLYKEAMFFSFCLRLFWGEINHLTGRDLADELVLKRTDWAIAYIVICIYIYVCVCVYVILEYKCSPCQWCSGS